MSYVKRIISNILGSSREDIIKRLIHIEMNSVWHSEPDYEDLVERLAKIDRSRYNGHYYWGQIKKSEMRKRGITRVSPRDKSLKSEREATIKQLIKLTSGTKPDPDMEELLMDRLADLDDADLNPYSHWVRIKQNLKKDR